jgi:hypothetical protein
MSIMTGTGISSGCAEETTLSARNIHDDSKNDEGGPKSGGGDFHWLKHLRVLLSYGCKLAKARRRGCAPAHAGNGRESPHLGWEARYDLQSRNSGPGCRRHDLSGLCFVSRVDALARGLRHLGVPFVYRGKIRLFEKIAPMAFSAFDPLKLRGFSRICLPARRFPYIVFFIPRR